MRASYAALAIAIGVAPVVDAIGPPRHMAPLRCTGKAKGERAQLGMIIPGNSPVEAVLVEGTGNFLAIYNYLITVRIILSWIPQAQGIALLRPVYQLCDPYLNLFRGLIPPIGPLDLSVLPAFFLLNFAQDAVPALGMDVPAKLKKMGTCVQRGAHESAHRIRAYGRSK